MHKDAKIGVFVQLVMEEIQKQSTASASKQIYISHIALNDN